MNEELLKEVLSDPAFATSLLEMENAEDVQAALKTKGVELSLADIDVIRQALVNAPEEGELNENELENVAGGSLTVMAALGIASLIGAAVGGTVKLGDAVNKWTRRRW